MPPTAATSMLTVCPAEDEKDNEGIPGPSAETQGTSEVPNESTPPAPPQIALTFLLVSGDRRTMTFDSEMTVGRVKELVWNAWPSGV